MLSRGRVWLAFVVYAGLCAAGTSLPAGEPWPAPVKDCKAHEAGEHPRLFFRKADLPAIKARAETPEGKEIVKRLRVLLDGRNGDTLPSMSAPAAAAKDDAEPSATEAAAGKKFSLWHAAGYGMLFHLTGEQKYADLARQCVEKMLAGQRDFDTRYSFIRPSGALRAGPSLGAMAMAYDLGYDGWDEAFRTKVALAMQNYSQGQWMSLAELARGSRQKPQSNHWGCQIGGAALALLAIRGDAGVDQKKVEDLLAVNEGTFIRNLTEGFGDGGYFMEHAGPGQISSDTAFIPAIQAYRVAAGKDFISPRPHVSAITLIRCYEMQIIDGKPQYMLRYPGSYGTGEFTPASGRGGLSRGGQFAQGFGAMKDEYKPAALWVYNHLVEPDPAKRTFDTVSPYPHRAVLALVNWPLGVAEKNPKEVLPPVHVDHLRGYYVFRNQWKDASDVQVAALFGARATDGPTGLMVWAGGKKSEYGACPKGETTHFEAKPDGSGSVTAGGMSLAVDFSRASDADAVIVATGTGAGGAKQAGKFFVTVIGKDVPVKDDGDKLTVGAQAFTFDGKKITFGQ